MVSGDCSGIDHVRLGRRFDGSMKITLTQTDGTQTRLPPDITPPSKALGTALSEAGITVQHHPFAPF